MASLMSLASCGFVFCSDGRMLVPLQEVRIRDFSGLMKHPR